MRLAVPILRSWVNASFWGWLWPRHLVTFQGRWYAPQTLAAWLQQTVYGNPLSSWLLESLLMGMLPALACVLAVVGYARRRSQQPLVEEHIRGVQLVSVHHLQQQIDGPRSWWPWRRPATADGVQIAGVVVPRALETSHFVITGSTGTGKSTILRRLLQQIARRGETAIVLDPECQLTPEFYDPTAPRCDPQSDRSALPVLVTVVRAGGRGGCRDVGQLGDS